MYADWKAHEEGKMAAKTPGKRRILLLCTDGGIHSDFAFKYYCKNVHKKGDFLVMLFCPRMDLQPGENVKGEDAAMKLGQLVLEEGNRVMKDAKIIENKLKENGIEGKVKTASAVIPPKESIIEDSVTENADLIILGARRLGKGLQQQGTTKQYVVRKFQVPVLICKHGKYEGSTSKPREGVTRLVVGGSDCTMHSLEGLKFYRSNIYREGDFMLLTYVPMTRPGSEIKNPQTKAITSTATPHLQDELKKLYADNASLLEEFIKDDLKMPGEVLIGEPGSNPGDVLLEVAEREGADLIVIGARGVSDQAYEASPRTSDKVANNSQVTVFLNKF